MKKSIFLILSISLFSIACNSSYRSLQKKFEEESSEFIVEVSTTPCYGTCPVYSLDIYSNGNAHFEGILYTDIEGEIEAQLPQSEVDSLKQFILANNFFKLDSIYDDPYISDLPSTIISVSVEGKKKRVKGRCNKPAEFNEIESFLARLVKRQFGQ